MELTTLVFVALALYVAFYLITRISDQAQLNRIKDEEDEARKHQQLAIFQREEKDASNRKKLKEQKEVTAKTRGRFEDFVHYKITEQYGSQVNIRYWFSTQNDMYALLIYRCMNTLPHNPEEVRRMCDRGSASLIKRVVVNKDYNELSSGENNPDLNGRITGEIIDRPVYEGRQMFFYCVMLENSSGGSAYFDGQQHILQKYSAVKHEEFKQGKLIAKARTKQLKEEIRGTEVIEIEDSLITDFEAELQEMLNKETSKTELFKKMDVFKKMINSDSSISEEDKEDLIDRAEGLAVRYMSK